VGDRGEVAEDVAGGVPGGMLWEQVFHDRGGAALRDRSLQAAHPATGVSWRDCTCGLPMLAHSKRRQRQGAAHRSCHAQDPSPLHCLLPHWRSWEGLSVMHSRSAGMLRYRRGEERCLPEVEPGEWVGRVFP